MTEQKDTNKINDNLIKIDKHVVYEIEGIKFSSDFFLMLAVIGLNKKFIITERKDKVITIEEIKE